LNQDFRDMLSALNDAGADFLVVGAYALAAHGLPRATGDIGIWVRTTQENAQRAWQAIGAFGAPRRELTIEDLTAPDIVFQIGVAPRRIDLLTSILGVLFDDAWAERKTVEIDGIPISLIGRHHLLMNKRATGRPKDVADVAWLESEEGTQR